MAIAGIQAVQGRKNGLQFIRDRLDPIAAVTGVQPTGFTSAGDPVVLKTQLKPLNNRCGAATDGQRHSLAEREPTQSPAHATGAAVFKLTQDPGEPH